MPLKPAAIALCLAASSAIVHAADVPNLVGTWNSSGELAAARSGKARAGFAETPTFNPPQHVSIVVEKQEGRGFTGYIVLPDGAKDPFAGVLKRDGKQALFSADNGKATIDFYGDSSEICWLDDLPGVNVASCAVIAKAP